MAILRLPMVRPVYLDALHCQDTELGTLEGRRPLSHNKRYAESLATKMTETWGVRKTYVTPVSETEHLPRITCWAWLTSPTTNAPEPEMDGSELVVVFFSNSFPEMVGDLVVVVGGLDWLKEAKDYQI